MAVILPDGRRVSSEEYARMRQSGELGGNMVSNYSPRQREINGRPVSEAEYLQWRRTPEGQQASFQSTMNLIADPIRNPDPEKNPNVPLDANRNLTNYNQRVLTPGAEGYNEAVDWMFQNPGKTVADWYAMKYPQTVPLATRSNLSAERMPGSSTSMSTATGDQRVPVTPPSRTPTTSSKSSANADPLGQRNAMAVEPPLTLAAALSADRMPGSSTATRPVAPPAAPATAMGGDRPVPSGSPAPRPNPPPPAAPPPQPPADTPAVPPYAQGTRGSKGEWIPANYFDSQGMPYAEGGAESYWYNPDEKAWYKGTLDGKTEKIGLSPPWGSPGNNKSNRILDVLSQFLGGGGQGGNSGLLSLASLLAGTPGQRPKSWLRPGVGYGDRPPGPGGEPARVTYFNEAGRPFRSGEDTRSYWFDQPDRQWRTGDLQGKVDVANQLPWQQLPWAPPQQWRTPGPGGNDDVNYYNASGQRFGSGDEKSYWFNRAENRWYEGSLDGTVKPITAPPFLAGIPA